MEYEFIFSFAVSVARSMKCVRDFAALWVEEINVYKKLI
jgi:hypothetical protein